MKNTIQIVADIVPEQPAKILAFDQSQALSDHALHQFSTQCSEKLSDLKHRVAAKLAAEFKSLSRQLLRQAVNEADALAATTPFPALVMPDLAEEKVRDAALWAARQRIISQRPLALAA